MRRSRDPGHCRPWPPARVGGPQRVRRLRGASRPVRLRRHLRRRIATGRPARVPGRRARPAPRIADGQRFAGPAGTSRAITTGRTASGHGIQGRGARNSPGAVPSPTGSARTTSSPTVPRLGAAPYICLNMGTGTLAEALAWIEYCNGAGRHRVGAPAPSTTAAPSRTRCASGHWGTRCTGTGRSAQMSAEEYVREATGGPGPSRCSIRRSGL